MTKLERIRLLNPDDIQAILSDIRKEPLGPAILRIAAQARWWEVQLHNPMKLGRLHTLWHKRVTKLPDRDDATAPTVAQIAQQIQERQFQRPGLQAKVTRYVNRIREGRMDVRLVLEKLPWGTFIVEGTTRAVALYLLYLQGEDLSRVLPLKTALFNLEPQREMTAEDAVEVIRLLEKNAIEVYVDGGWAVDALLGEETRTHEDLDIAVPHKHVPKLRELLGVKGYKDVPRDDNWEANFVLGDDKGHQVDVHSYTFDEEGNNVFGVSYEPKHLHGTGSIKGYAVKCISPEWMVRFHSGYELDEDDYRDVKALCERFGISLPAEYKKFVDNERG